MRNSKRSRYVFINSRDFRYCDWPIYDRGRGLSLFPALFSFDERRKNKPMEITQTGYSLSDKNARKGAFLWRYPGYSHSGIGITEYTEYQFAI